MVLRQSHRYERTGYLAVSPGAFSALFEEFSAQDSAGVSGDCAIVRVSGPLESRPGTWWDDYESIVARVRAACSGPLKSVAIVIDSPGGNVSGMVDAAREIRSIANACGKRVVAYCANACSAAYALASAANEVYVPSTGVVGSIGVIEARLDATRADDAMGLRVAMITSGARKADGHPSVPLSDEELAAKQAIVDSMAAEFFALVAEHRKVDAEMVRSLQASVFAGNAAKMHGLADDVMSFSECLAMLNATGATGMEEDKEKVLEALRALAECDDEDLKARAAKALAAMTEEESAEEEKKEEAPAEEASAKSAVATAGAMAAVANGAMGRIAALEAKLEAQERASLLAARPDVDESLKAVLATTPVAEVRKILSAIKRPAAPKPAATAVVATTRGEAQGQTTARLSPEAKLALDARMGLAAVSVGAHATDHKLTLGAVTVKPKGGDNG